MVDDPDVAGVAAFKPADDTILVVHPDAEEACVVTLQRFETVGQVPRPPVLVEAIELPPRNGPELRRQTAPRRLAPHSMKDVLGALVGEVEDQMGG